MNSHKLLYQMVGIGIISLLLSGCTGAIASPTAVSPTATSLPPTATAVLQYESVDPTELTCYFTLPEGVSLTEEMGADGQTHIRGSIADLICEGKEVELESNEIVDGFITTKEFGKIMIKVNFATFSAEMFMLPEEKDKLEEWAKGQ